MKRFSGQVHIFGKVWVTRVASTYCAPCGVGQLTEAGKAELVRGIEATSDVLGSGDADPKPRLEFCEADGLVHQVDLMFAERGLT